ncbi:hypothetical protein HY311_02810 [Candidatus Nomurabacteria bacterium]|nr:hypothetical protein [Candidatus Nomurabacteria bacterium]
MKKLIIILILITLGISAFVGSRTWAPLPQTQNTNTNTENPKSDLIRVETPQPGENISSPVVIKGTARGSWFFEASFPVVLADWDGLIIAQGTAKAKGDWMTADFVPFEATLTFKTYAKNYSNKGTLILRKDNPSGLPKNNDSLEIPVFLINQ